MADSDGYPFIFQMIDRDATDNLLVEALQYRFKSEKSHHIYIVRIEKYQEHAYCVKFFDKANRNSQQKFSLRTNTFEPRTIFYTIFHILLDVLKKDEKASFFFIGAEDERDVLGSSTRRFKVYFRFVTSIVSDKLFAHFPIEDDSLYILVNKRSVEDRTSYASRIISMVRQEYSHQ